MRKIKFLTLILAVCTVAFLAVSTVGFAARVFADDATAKIEFSRTPSKAFTDFEKEGGIKNIEDLVGEANSYKLLNEGAYIDENKNVVLESRDSSPGQDANNGRLRSLTIKNDYKDIGVKYKFKKDGDKEIMILNEVRGTLVESFYWATSVNPQVMFVYNPDSKLVRFAFTVNGLGDLEWDKCNSNLELKADEYITVEYGAINVNDDFLLFIRVTNGSGATAYGEALYREATVNQSGFIKIYNSCYNSFMRGGGADGVFSSPNNMQNVTIEGINAPTMSKYVFKGEKESNFKTYDISAYGEVRFATLFTENYYLWEGWNKCFKCESWVEWSFKNNGDGTWAFTAVGGQNSYTSTVQGSTLEQLAYNYYAGDNKTVYVTEFRGELLSHFNVSGEVITDTLFEDNKHGSTMQNVTAANVKMPYGFKKVWQHKMSGADIHGGMFSGKVLSAYKEVRFALKSNAGIKCGTFNPWEITNHGGEGVWTYVTLTQNDDATWNLVAKQNGKTIYTVDKLSATADNDTYTANSLNALLYGGNFGFYPTVKTAGDYIYYTEVRGVPKTDKQLTRIAVASKYEDETSDRREDAIINYYAIKEAKKWFGEFANIDGVEYITDESMLSSSVYYIVIGNAFSDGDYSELTTDTGYKIVKRNGNVYLYGKTGYGTLNALYGLLKQRYNLEIYADTVYTFSDAGDLYYEEIREETFNPSIDYNLAYDGPLTYIKEGEVNPNYDYQRRLGFVDSWQQIGGSWHNFLDYVPQSEYGTAHPEWYTVACYENGEKSTVTTLDLTTGGDAMAKVVADKIKAQVEADEAGQNIKPVYVFGPPDERVWSNSKATIRTVAKYGTRSAEYVKFMNNVAKRLDKDYTFDRQIKLCLIAYNLVCDAPDYHADLKFYNGDEISLSVMFAPIESNMYRAADDTTPNYKYHLTNARFTEQLSKWKALGGEVYYWNYSEYFDNYFVMLDTITNMQSKYKLMAENGVNRLIDLGMVGDNYGTDFTALKIYLKGKLARNVNENVDALVKNFCSAYYGTGGEYIYSLLTSEQARYKKVSDLSTKANNGEDAVGIHVIREGVAVKSYWDENEFDTWYGYIKSALTAIENSGATEKAKTEYKKRVMREGIAVRYMKYYVFNSFITLASGETDSIFAMITDAKSVNITRFAEGQAYVWDKRPSIIYNGRWKLVDGSIDNLA